MQVQSKPRVFLSLGLTYLALLLAVTLAVGVTYGRYSTLIQGEMALIATLPSEPTLYSLDGDGHPVDFAPQWLREGGEQYLSFLLQNCSIDEGEPPQQDIRVRIRVFVPDHSDTMGALALTLRIGNGSVPLSSGAAYLGANTPQYTEEKIAGWVYSFYETNVETGRMTEYIHTFRGGSFETLPITVTVQNTEIDCSSFRICVERVADGAS